MQVFFSGSGGVLFPMSRIVEIRFGQKEGAKRLFYVDLKSPEQTVVIDEEVKDRITSAPLAIIAAQPGTMLIDGTDKTGSPFVEDVIGWAIASDGSPTPITASGYDDGCTNPWAIKLPSGRIVRPFAGSYDNVEEYLESL